MLRLRPLTFEKLCNYRLRPDLECGRETTPEHQKRRALSNAAQEPRRLIEHVARIVAHGFICDYVLGAADDRS
jgi:hypothetical protein